MVRSKRVADVAIVGAGAAGLMAAQQLTNAGRSVVVIEARDRVGGPAAQRLSHRPPRAIVDDALASLATITGVSRARLANMLVASHVADWQADELSRGAYSYVTVGNLDAPKKLAKSVQNTLFFAGEATASGGVGGTVDAALASGRRAADEILAARPHHS